MISVFRAYRAISLGVERTLFSVESISGACALECLLRVLNRRVAVAKDASPWQKQALNKLDASSRKLRALESLRGP